MIKSNFQITTNEDSAIITHYFQNANTKYALPFEEDAIKILYGDDVVKTNVVEEPFVQYNLFPELLTVPFPAPENPKFTCFRR